MSPERPGFDEVIQDYLDFTNRQLGAYMDALSGFEGNRRVIEYQTARVQRPVGSRVDDHGTTVMMYASVEDSSQPDVIHHRIIRAQDYLAANASGGTNEQQYVQAVLVFLFTHWELETRPCLAAAKPCNVNEIRADIMGDLRLLRNVILHAKGVIQEDKLIAMKKVGPWLEVGKSLHITSEQMKQIFQWIHQACALLLFEWLGMKDAKGQSEKIVTLALENVRRTTPRVI